MQLLDHNALPPSARPRSFHASSRPRQPIPATRRSDELQVQGGEETDGRHHDGAERKSCELRAGVDVGEREDRRIGSVGSRRRRRSQGSACRLGGAGGAGVESVGGGVIVAGGRLERRGRERDAGTGAVDGGGRVVVRVHGRVVAHRRRRRHRRRNGGGGDVAGRGILAGRRVLAGRGRVGGGRVLGGRGRLARGLAADAELGRPLVGAVGILDQLDPVSAGVWLEIVCGQPRVGAGVLDLLDDRVQRHDILAGSAQEEQGHGAGARGLSTRARCLSAPSVVAGFDRALLLTSQVIV